MKTLHIIQMTSHEVQSGSDRVRHAEGLILQLPKTHEGRNTWLVNYGVSAEAAELRKQYMDMNAKELQWDENTESLKPLS